MRIAKANGRLSGVLWDGKGLFLIDNSEEVAPALFNGRRRAQPYHLIYRLADVDFVNAQCALAANAKPLNHFGAMTQELQTIAGALPAGTRELSLAAVADSQFVKANSVDPEAAVVARMNVVDGIFTEQVGAHVNLGRFDRCRPTAP